MTKVDELWSRAVVVGDMRPRAPKPIRAVLMPTIHLKLECILSISALLKVLM